MSQSAEIKPPFAFKKHPDAYLDEFEFRFNNRNNPFIFRDAMKELVTAANMEYKELTSPA